MPLISPLISHGVYRGQGSAAWGTPERGAVCDDSGVSHSTRIARPLRREAQPASWWRALLGLLMLTFALGLVARRYGADQLAPWALPAIVFIAALVLVWSPLDGAVQSDPRRPDVVSLFSRDAWARVVVGVGLAVAAVAWLAQWDFGTAPLAIAVCKARSATSALTSSSCNTT